MSEDFKEKFRDKWEEGRSRWEQRMERRDNRHGHIWSGVFILLIGVAALVKATVTDLPDWVFSWQTFLIVLGLFIGFKHNFKSPSWFILIIIGSVFLVRDIYPDLAIRRYIWPIALIAVGAFLIIKPRNSRQWRCVENQKKKQLPVTQE